MDGLPGREVGIVSENVGRFVAEATVDGTVDETVSAEGATEVEALEKLDAILSDEGGRLDG